MSQQGAIAATHQGEAALHKTDSTIAEVVGFPGAFGNALGSEQNLGNRSIGIALGPRIERAEGQCQSLSALRRDFMESRTGSTPVKRTPETSRCMHADVEIIVEWQFGCIRLAVHRCVSQPKPMLDPAHAQ